MMNDYVMCMCVRAQDHAMESRTMHMCDRIMQHAGMCMTRRGVCSVMRACDGDEGPRAWEHGVMCRHGWGA